VCEARAETPLEEADLEQRVVAGARRWGVHLPAGLGARCPAELWGQPVCEAISTTLLGGLRLPERLAARCVERCGIDSLTLNRMYLARLLSGRPSRVGWAAAWRRLWPHPGILATAAPPSWPWWDRRAWLAASNLEPAAGRLKVHLERRARRRSNTRSTPGG